MVSPIFTSLHDLDPDWWGPVTGRIDDMLNCSGHLMSTAQIESVLVEHAHVAEAAVVPVAHAIKAGFPYIQRKGGRYYMGGCTSIFYFILSKMEQTLHSPSDWSQKLLY